MDGSQPPEAEWDGAALRIILFQEDPLVESRFDWKSYRPCPSDKILRLLVCCSGPGSAAIGCPSPSRYREWDYLMKGFCIRWQRNHKYVDSFLY